MVKPLACWRSRPVGETRLPVARKFESLAPMSKEVLDRTLVRYLPGKKMARTLKRLTIKVRLTVIEIHVGLAPHVGVDSGTNAIEDFVQSFLNDHTVEGTREKNLLMLRRIGVIRATCSRDKRVDFSKHKAGQHVSTGLLVSRAYGLQK